MRSAKRSILAYQRLEAALLLLVLVVLMPLGVTVLRTAVHAPEAFRQVQLVSGLLIEGDQGLESLVAEYEQSDAVDQDFRQELFDPMRGEAVRYAADVGVCSFESEDSPEDLFASLSSSMKEKGWFAFSSGQPLCSVFMKEGGRYTWALVSCGEVGGKTVALCCASDRKEAL